MDTHFFIQYFFRKTSCRNFTVVTNSNLPLLIFLHPDGILFKILKFDITVIRLQKLGKKVWCKKLQFWNHARFESKIYYFVEKYVTRVKIYKIQSMHIDHFTFYTHLFTFTHICFLGYTDGSFWIFPIINCYSSLFWVHLY